MLNRTIEPEIKEINQVELQQVAETKLANNIPVYMLNAGTQELSRIEFLFPAGYIKQNLPLVASTTNDLIDEGTATKNSQQIADGIDYFGAFLETEITPDYASVNVFSLNKHLVNVLPLIEEVIKQPIFPQHELEVNIQNKKQKYLVSEQKVNDVARKKFNQLIFGNAHPYGYFVQLSDFDNVKREHLQGFHPNFYNSSQCKIIASGKIDDSVLKLLEKHFGGNDWKGNSSSLQKQLPDFNATKEHTNIVLKQDALQSAIRIGKPLFNKTHADYLPMLVLNTILGGYFGSRLMANIREDKGYTYGIGSAIQSMEQGGYFFITTEVGADVTKNAVNEIFSEIKRLREDLVSEPELNLVRSYMLGSFLSSVDGPFALADRFKGIMTYGLSYDYYDRYIKTIKTISANELRDLANKYWKEEDLIELVVGKKN